MPDWGASHLPRLPPLERSSGHDPPDHDRHHDVWLEVEEEDGILATNATTARHSWPSCHSSRSCGHPPRSCWWGCWGCWSAVSCGSWWDVRQGIAGCVYVAEIPWGTVVYKSDKNKAVYVEAMFVKFRATNVRICMQKNLAGIWQSTWVCFFVRQDFKERVYPSAILSVGELNCLNVKCRILKKLEKIMLKGWNGNHPNQ